MVSFACHPHIVELKLSDSSENVQEQQAECLWINKQKVVTWSCSILFIFSVRFPEDLEDENTTFNPEYSHQVFGDE